MDGGEFCLGMIGWWLVVFVEEMLGVRLGAGIRKCCFLRFSAENREERCIDDGTLCTGKGEIGWENTSQGSLGV